MSGSQSPRAPLALVVDDDPVLRTIGSESLSAIGFEIVEAETGEAALTLADARTPDLVLLDVQLPGRDGFSVCEEMRAWPAMADVPILIATGRTDPETIDRTFQVGATDFIKKPLDWQLLQHRVRFLMRANTAFKDLKSTLSDLEKSRRELEAARELGHMGIWELDPQTGEMLWSDELHRLVGMQPSAGAPPTWEGFRSLVPNEDWAGLDKAVAEAISAGRPATVEHRLVDVHGETRFVHEYIETAAGLSGEHIIRGTIQDITDRRRAEVQLEFLETFDSLTHLPNRAFLRDRLERLVARGRRGGASLAILCVDLDRFDRVNQALGYANGDDLLRAVGERLLDSVRATDFVGRGVEPPDVSRFGGDEFTVVLTGLVSEATARQAASRILRSLAKPFHVDNHSIPLSASIGIAMFNEDCDDTDALISHAGVAMSWAKKTGGGSYRFFDQTANQNAAKLLTLESDLAAAIENDELTLDYQPQCDAETGELLALEALVRWNHPRLGRLLPGDFIPAAEACGLIGTLGEWVLREACRQARAWEAAGLPRLRISVNVSTLQFNHGRMVEMVRTVLAETGLEATRLELEITETALLGDGEHVLRTCEALRGLGVGLALDDFGTGYSSLSHLFDFKIDTLKIDRSFTARIRPGDKACEIIAAVIAMAKRMDITVVAEGVEEPDQEAFLRAEGCHLLQGFGICRPGQPDVIEAWIGERA
ncbi:MAG: EAL domain-containing protein [bacterium]|nr:EAL domain-containing protein [bacterium]